MVPGTDAGACPQEPERSTPVRSEADLQGHHRSDETPACHRCGLPLLAEAEFCPYCERWLNEGALPRLFRRRSPGGRLRGASERIMLVAGLALFAIVATVSILAAVAA